MLEKIKGHVLHTVAKFRKLPHTLKLKLFRVIGVAVLIFAIAIFITYKQNQPERSVASFCTYYKTNQSAQNWSQDWSTQLQFYKQLEARAPKDIQPQVKVIQQNYEQMIKNPGAAMGINLSITGTGLKFNDWVNMNCYPEKSSNLRKSQQEFENFYRNQSQPNPPMQSL